MLRSPLIAGANLTLLDKDTVSLLTNTDMLRVDQTSMASRQVLHEDDLVVWTADLPGNQHALALFNLGEKSITVNRPLTDFALTDGPHKLQNVWSQKDVWTGTPRQPKGHVSVTLDPHACLLLMVK